MARGSETQTQHQNAPDYLAWHVTQRSEKADKQRIGAVWAMASHGQFLFCKRMAQMLLCRVSRPSVTNAIIKFTRDKRFLSL